PRRTYDRTIVVRLTRDAVLVDYRLEVDEWTVVYVDLPAVSDKLDLTRLSKPREFYEAITRHYAPILADNLTATLDGKPLTFTSVKQGFQVLDHLRCDFVFRAPWQPAPNREHVFTFREGNYELESGRVRLSLGEDATVSLLNKSVPDAALQERPTIELKPG